MTTGPLTREIAYAIERIEAEATADMLRAAPFWRDEFRLDLGMHRIGASAYGFHLDEIDFQTFSRVLCLGIGEPATPAQVDAVLNPLPPYLDALPRDAQPLRRASGATRLAAAARPARQQERSLGKVLPRRGAATGNTHRFPCGVRGQEGCKPLGGDRARRLLPASGAATLDVPGGGASGLAALLAYDGDYAVVCGALYLQNGVGWLGFSYALADLFA